ncbi:MAG: hypothetical protein IKN47_01610 [Lachnospiraceae bacterium]|nr:hypothetical protein [Lachnospiraceae bacterium]
MTNTKDLIMKLKEVRDEKNLSYGDIIALMEKNGDYLAKSTIARVFGDGSEDLSFRYEETIRPIAKALLDIENIEDDDTMNVQAMKSLLKFKIQRIEELEQQIEHLKSSLDKEKIKSLEKLEHEREQFDKERKAWADSIEFLKEQVSYKDKRMDFFLDALKDKDETIKGCMCCTHRKVVE